MTELGMSAKAYHCILSVLKAIAARTLVVEGDHLSGVESPETGIHYPLLVRVDRARVWPYTTGEIRHDGGSAIACHKLDRRYPT